MKKNISVVIPNFNGKHLIERNLPTVYAALHAANLEHEVIIVDDATKQKQVEKSAAAKAAHAKKLQHN